MLDGRELCGVYDDVRKYYGFPAIWSSLLFSRLQKIGSDVGDRRRLFRVVHTEGGRLYIYDIAGYIYIFRNIYIIYMSDALVCL